MCAARRLIVVTSRYPFGSQEAYLNSELAELSQYFERIAVMPVRPPADPPRHPVPEGVEVLAWPLFGREILWRALRAFLKRPRAVVRVLAQVLQSRDPGRTKNLGVAAKAIALAQWTMENGFDHIHAYWMSTPATVAMIAAMVSDRKWSSTAHRWDIYEHNAFDLKERSVSFVRTISRRGTQDLATRMPALNSRVLELRLGISVNAAPSPSRSQDQAFRLVCPAALVPVKGHTDLFEALAQLRDWGVAVSCTLCGTGPLRGELETEVARLGLERIVEFAGFVPQEILHQWYRSSRFSAVVLASRDVGESMMEGIPSALLEAMAFGVPVVTTDSGSIGELVDGLSGSIVRAGSPPELARALLHVYLDPAAAQARARHAHQVVSARHNVSVQMRKLAAAFERRE